MTQPSTDDQAAGPTERRTRGPNKVFPPATFEQALELPKGILQHGVDGEIQRLTLMDKMQLAASSSKTQQLISSSTKYGLTSGGFKAPSMAITDDGRMALDPDHPSPATTQKQFELSIARFDPFQSTYNKLKEKRLPDEVVLADELMKAGTPQDDCATAAEIFSANLRYLGLVEEISGRDHVRSIEQIIQALPPGDPGKASAVVAPASDDDAATDPATTRAVSPTVSTSPSVHIDIQIHIDSSATGEQIDKIFASMAKHLYGRDV